MQSIDGDGVSDQFFLLLWQKDELNFGPAVNLPDTIIFKFGQPIHWFFTGVDGKLKKKNKQNLVNVKIEEAFTRLVVGCDIVAYFISLAEDEDPETSTNIEYFDRSALRDFLYNRRQESGMLQRFIEPKGTQNSMVRAIWSPKVCLLERRQNNKQLHDARYGLHERALTYDGPEYFSSAAPLRGSILPSKIQRICENVVTHIAEVTFQKQRICRIVLNFKVDARDRVWLLFTSSIRLASDAAPSGSGIIPNPSPLNIDSIVKVAPTVKLADQVNHAGPEAVQSSADPLRSCVSCGGEERQLKFHNVSYKNVITHFEHVIALVAADSKYGTAKWPPDPAIVMAAGGVGFGCPPPERPDRQENKHGEAPAISEEDVLIPPVVRHLHPNLTAAIFKRYRRDPLFLYKTACVCEDCYLVFAELASAGVQPVTVPDLAPPKRTLRRIAGGTGSSPAPPATEWLVAEPGAAGSSSMQRSRRRRSNREPGTEDGGGLTVLSESQSGSVRHPPSFPGAIRSPASLLLNSASLSAESAVDGPGMEPATIEEMVQSREDAFFREMGQSDARNGSEQAHPLTHLINSYDKMQSVNRTPIVTASADGKSSSFTTTAVKKSTNPYMVPQVLVESKKRRARRPRPAKPPQPPLTNTVAGATAAVGGSGDSGAAAHGSGQPTTTAGGASGAVSTGLAGTASGAPSTNIVKTMAASSRKHRAFLEQALTDVKNMGHTQSSLQQFVQQRSAGSAAYPTVPRPDGAASESAHESVSTGPVVLLQLDEHEIDGTMVSVMCLEESTGPRREPDIRFRVTSTTESDGLQWDFSVQPGQIGLAEGAWAGMPLEEKAQLCEFLAMKLHWAGEDGRELEFDL